MTANTSPMPSARLAGLTLWPRSLVARMTALVVITSLMSLGLHMVATQLFGDTAADGMTASIAGRVRMVQDVLLRAPEAQRALLAERFSDERFSVHRGGLDPQSYFAQPPRPASHFLDALRLRMDSQIQVRLLKNPSGLVTARVGIEFPVDGDIWRVEQGLDPPVLALLGMALGWLVLITAAVMATLALGVRSIASPILVITRRLAEQRTLLHPLQTPAHASSEIETLVGSFNALVATVAAADETKRHLLAGVSHDLRTPLARLRLRIETQCEPMVADELSADLHAVERIVSQFLAYVQGDSKAGSGDDEPVGAVVSSVVGDYVERGAEVSTSGTELDALLPELAVRRLLGNLIDNALSHGRAPVGVQLERVEDPGANAGGRSVGRLTVWDGGRGMSADEFRQARLPFVRLAGSRAGVGHCGLGLAIVSQIADQIGGELGIRRDPDGRFGISLSWPVAEASVPD